MSDNRKHNVLIPEVGLRVKALESLLAEKGVINSAALDLIVETFQKQLGPQNGAKVVAKAWVDPEYKKWLLKDGTAAIKHLGFSGVQGENSGRKHPKTAQRCRLHALLLLPVAYAWAASDLVQVGTLPLTRRCGATQRARGIRRDDRRRRRGPNLGQLGGVAVPRAADAARQIGRSL